MDIYDGDKFCNLRENCYNDYRNKSRKFMMNLLSDPNVAYVLLVFGFVLGVLALFAPGTGILEFGALGAMALAGYSILRLPINLWALIILVFGAIPFFLAMRRLHRWPFLLLALVALIVGTVFVFRGERGEPAIHPAVATVASLSAVIILWIVGRKAIDVMGQIPSHDLSHIIGLTGEALTPIHRSGSIYVGGENWSACSEKPVPAGSIVRVIDRQGLVLRVEILHPKDKS
jgi:membrane-bound ClpP family serine protease